jgi:hypothetical protein
MATLEKLIAQAREKHAKLGIFIEVCEEMVATNGHRSGKVERAMAMIDNTDVAGKPRKRKNKGVASLPEVDPIPNLDVSGMKLTDAIAATLKAAGRRMPSMELAALINHAGMKLKDARGVAVTAAGMAKRRQMGVRRNARSGLLYAR